MKKRTRFKNVAMLCLLSVSLGSAYVSALAHSVSETSIQSEFASAWTQNADIFTVHYLGNGETDQAEASCSTWDTTARQAFDHAVGIWASVIFTPTVPIVIQACWADLPAGQLGYVESGAYPANFPGAPFADTVYPLALANTLAEQDLNPPLPEIHITYNKNYNWSHWYFGTDASQIAGDQYDFISSVLRQITHGLGFHGFMRVSGEKGYQGFGPNNYPSIYDRFSKNGAGQNLISFPNATTALKVQLTSGDVYFDGYSANIANGESPPKLYAPSVWEENTSYIYLDEATFTGTEDALMTPFLEPGEAYREPGPVTLGVLRDLGWEINKNTPPRLGGLPDQELMMNTRVDKAVDLWAYASDVETADDARLEFSITPASPHVSLTKDEVNPNQRYLNLHPASGWAGETTITVRVRDPEGLFDTDTFSLTVTNSPPTLKPFSDPILAPMNIPYTQVLDLRRYAYDAEDLDSSLVFTLTEMSEPDAGVRISDNRFLDVIPTMGFTGTCHLVLEVQDSAHASATTALDVTVTKYNITPTISVSDKRLFINTSRQIDLWDLDWDGEHDYARDPEGGALTIRLENTASIDANAGITLSQDQRYILITPVEDWTGATNVEVSATDPDGLMGTDTFNVEVWTYDPIYIPLIMRDFNSSGEEEGH